jgi:hypothetical protein
MSNHVSGAMVYGVCYYPISDEKVVKKMGFAGKYLFP